MKRRALGLVSVPTVIAGYVIIIIVAAYYVGKFAFALLP